MIFLRSAYYFIFILVIWLPLHLYCTPEEPEITFEDLYINGKSAYSREEWGDCIAFMLKALEDFNFYLGEKIWCRQKCTKEIAGLNENHKINDDTNLLFHSLMYTQAQKALCLFRCQIWKFTEERPPMKNFQIYEDFQNRKPYEYLHFCYYKLGDLERAVKYSYTVLVGNSKNEDALTSLKFYMEQENFKKEMLVDALRKTYEESYINGVEAYNNKEWNQCVYWFESSLTELWEEDEKCRLTCEDRIDFSSIENDNPEISIVFTSIYYSVVSCQHNCIEKLSKVNGHQISNFLSSYFEYLHVCFFNENRGRDVGQSIENAILLNPSNMVSRQNKLFYINTYKDFGEKDLFTPSPKIVEYYIRYQNEKKLLDFVNQKFRFENLWYTAPTDKSIMDWSVDIKDYFDYSKLSTVLITDDECELLKLSGELEYLKAKNKFHKDELLEEIGERIAQKYETQVKFKSLHCNEEVECKRSGFTFSIEKETCSSLVNPSFPGCVVVFCNED
uniref:Procollagen-proline 3-dioxygenase n=1 Tax=Strongyloides papillosus TaxID=174720 RepID=A0A0N5CEM2_STREA